MDIKKYTSFFHDGSILEINDSGSTLIVLMESAEMDAEDLKDDAILTSNNRLKGRLHIEGVKSIMDSKKNLVKTFEMKREDAEILKFRIDVNHVQFQILWDSFPRDILNQDFTDVDIEAKNIWWENLSV